MDSDDCKATESENGSDNSYVQVSSEDAQLHTDPADPGSQQLPLHDSPQLLSGSGIPEEGDLRFGEGITTHQESVQTSDVKLEDPFYMESHDPEEEKTEPASLPVESPPTKVGGVEDVQSSPSDSPVSSTALSAPKATGYLCFLNYLHPAVLYLVYWQDPKMSAVVLGVDMVVLLTLNMNTLLHTLVLLLLSFLVVSLTYIVTKIAIDSFYNRSVRNPFSDYLNKNIALPEEKIRDWTLYLVGKLNKVFNVLVRLLLFDNIQRSLKFGVVLWLVSFVTNCLSFMTTAIFVVIFLFAAPPIYSRYQLQIDHVIKSLICRSSEMLQMVKNHIPFLTKRKVE